LTAGFLTLGDLVLTPPLPAVISILLVTGATGISEAAIRRMRPDAAVPQRAAAFVVTIGVCGATVHALALAHLANLLVLRVIAGAMVAAGCATIVFKARAVLPLWRDALRFWKEAALRDRVATLAVVLAVLGLVLAACGPVTDADSLDYHLGVPLAWLRQESVAPQPHWMHTRLVGLGEAINMLGLAAGTNGLGSAVQVSGLIALMWSMCALAKTANDRLFALLLALPPAILPLATAQKPQLSPWLPW
jgi:hypothetical protein